MDKVSMISNYKGWGLAGETETGMVGPGRLAKSLPGAMHGSK
jgi:hypothetical protein